MKNSVRSNWIRTLETWEQMQYIFLVLSPATKQAKHEFDYILDE